MATIETSASDRLSRVNYMTSFLREFRKMAYQDGHYLLGYLLEIALLEAGRTKEEDPIEVPFPGADEMRFRQPRTRKRAHLVGVSSDHGGS